MSTVMRDTFILEMEDNLKECTTLAFNQARAWESVYRVEKTNKRRVEKDTYVHPSVTAITKEGAPLNRLTVRRGYNSFVVPDTLTGEVKVTDEFIRHNQYPEIQRGSFGLGTAMARKRYKDAMAFIYNAFSGVTSPDNRPVFDDSHVLVNGGGAVGDNLLTGPLNSDNLDAAVTMLLTQLDENGDILPSDLGRLQLIVPPKLRRTAKQLVGSEKEPETMNNAINVFHKDDDYNIEVKVLPLLAEAPSAFKDTQWYLREVSNAENVFYEGLTPETWMVNDIHTLCVLHQCKDSYGIVWHDWRYWVGSKGNG